MQLSWLTALVLAGVAAVALSWAHLAARRLAAANARLSRQVEAGSAALHRSEQHLAAALEAARMYGWEWDLVSNRIVFTQGAEAMLGLSEASFAEITARIDPTDRAQRQAVIRRALAGQGPYEIEFRYLGPKGPVWLASRGRVRFDDAGRPVLVQGVAFDITDRKQAEQARADSEERLRRVQRIGRVGGFEIEFTTGVNRRSGEYMAVQGLEAAPRLESHEDWVQRLHPEDRARAEATFLRAIRADVPDTEYAQEYRIVTPSGEVRWISARAEIERDAQGRPLCMRGAHIDVTELKRMSEALRQSEQRLRLAIEGAGMATWDTDIETGSTVWSESHFTLFGYPPAPDGAATLGMWRARVHPDDLAGVEQARARALQADQPYRAEYRIVLPGGAVRWISAFGRGLSSAAAEGSNRRDRLVGVMFDVTEKKQSEVLRALLAREVDHRARNALAVVQALVRLSSAPSVATFAAVLHGRIAALARAHTLLSREHWQGVSLHEAAEAELAAYMDRTQDARLVLEGPAVLLRPDAVQPLSLVLHELATNAAKYGAWRTGEGRVRLSWHRDGADPSSPLALCWTERGGPPVAVPLRQGFGSTLIETGVRTQLGGTLHTDWAAEGISVHFTIGPDFIEAGHAAVSMPDQAGAAAPGATPELGAAGA